MKVRGVSADDYFLSRRAPAVPLSRRPYQCDSSGDGSRMAPSGRWRDVAAIFACSSALTIRTPTNRRCSQGDSFLATLGAAELTPFLSSKAQSPDADKHAAEHVQVDSCGPWHLGPGSTRPARGTRRSLAFTDSARGDETDLGPHHLAGHAPSRVVAPVPAHHCDDEDPPATRRLDSDLFQDRRPPVAIPHRYPDGVAGDLQRDLEGLHRVPRGKLGGLLFALLGVPHGVGSQLRNQELRRLDDLGRHAPAGEDVGGVQPRQAHSVGRVCQRESVSRVWCLGHSVPPELGEERGVRSLALTRFVMGTAGPGFDGCAAADGHPGFASSPDPQNRCRLIADCTVVPGPGTSTREPLRRPGKKGAGRMSPATRVGTVGEGLYG